MMEAFSLKKPYRGRVRAVILDWEGVAVDFGCLETIQPFIETFAQNWVEVTPEEIREHVGLSYWDQLAAMLQSGPVSAKWLDIYGSPASEHDLERLYRSIEQAASPDLHSDLVPGLLETVAEFRKREIRIGSTSSLGAYMMEPLAEAAGEKGYRPDAVVCVSDGPAGRPHPFMCYKNAIDLGVYPLEAMVKIAGTVPGVQEGLNAGMWTVAVTRSSGLVGLTRDEMANMDPAAVEDKLEEAGKVFAGVGAHFVVKDLSECLEVVDGINWELEGGERV
jgi:phosphonoacetaldehyde hydrolase